jgi:hypothetical protein
MVATPRQAPAGYRSMHTTWIPRRPRKAYLGPWADVCHQRCPAPQCSARMFRDGKDERRRPPLNHSALLASARPAAGSLTRLALDGAQTHGTGHAPPQGLSPFTHWHAPVPEPVPGTHTQNGMSTGHGPPQMAVPAAGSARASRASSAVRP